MPWAKTPPRATSVPPWPSALRQLPVSATTPAPAAPARNASGGCECAGIRGRAPCIHIPVSRRAALLALLALSSRRRPRAAQAATRAAARLRVRDRRPRRRPRRRRAGAVPRRRLLRGRRGARATYYRSRARSWSPRPTRTTRDGDRRVRRRLRHPRQRVRGLRAARRADCCADGDGRARRRRPTARTRNCLLAENVFAPTRQQAAPDGDHHRRRSSASPSSRASSRREVAAPAYDADHLWTPCADPGDDDALLRAGADQPDDRLRGRRQRRDGRGAAHGARGRERRRRRPSGPNLTFVNLPQVDSAGHASGTGPAYDAAIAQADGEIERFVAAAARARAVGAHGDVRASPTTRWTRRRTKTSLTAALHGRRGSPTTTTWSCRTAASTWSTSPTATAADALRSCSSGCARRRCARAPMAGGRRGALPRAEPGGRRGRAHARRACTPAGGIAGERSGDLRRHPRRGRRVHRPEPNPLPGNHGGPQTRDNMFAVVGGGRWCASSRSAGAVDAALRRHERNPGQAENVDVAPTVTRAARPAPRRATARGAC